MKLKTSCYDPATGRMNLRRFAPIWILYTIGLLLFTAMLLGPLVNDGDSAILGMRTYLQFMVLFNFGYAVVMAQLMFGDLYNQKLSYTMHALPIPRSGWFGTQIILTLLGSLIPNLINFAFLQFFFSGFRIVTLWWLLLSEAQFLTAYGFAVLCAICAGNRIGMLILYAMVNLADVLVAWLRLKLYAPLIYGLHIPDLEMNLSPLVALTKASDFTVFYDKKAVMIEGRERFDYYISNLSLNDNVWMLAAYAAAGCAAIWLAMFLYRRRPVESAGELLAFPIMEKPIVVLCALFGGCAMHMISMLFGNRLNYLLLAVGLIAGYYASLMLLRRKVNVFTLKTVPPVALICAAMVLSLTLTGLDVFGITNRVPDADQVERVHMTMNYRSSLLSSKPEDIAQTIDLQKTLLEEHRAVEESRPLLTRIFASEDRAFDMEQGYPAFQIRLQYKLKDGSAIYRIYHVTQTSQTMPVLRRSLSSPDVVFSDQRDTLLNGDGTLDAFAERVTFMRFHCQHRANEYEYEKIVTIAPEQQKGLLDAILADCREGNAAQEHLFHDNSYANDLLELYYSTDTEEAYFSLYLWEDCANTMAYLRSIGLHE